MSKYFKIILSALLVLTLVGSIPTFAANVRITGDCNVRRGPGLGYDKIDTVKKGEVMEYWDRIETDERGVDWYNVIYGNLSAWVSSKYAVLELDEGEYQAEDSSSNGNTVLEVIDGKTDILDALGYPPEDMVWLLNMRDDGYGYSNDFLFSYAEGGVIGEIDILAANQKYCAQGVTFGMSVADAERQLFGRGWKLTGIGKDDADWHPRFYTNAQGNEIELSTNDSDDFKSVSNIAVRLYEHDW